MRYTEIGRRHFAKAQYQQAATMLAIAYAMDPQPALLYEIARACRKADLDVEALAAYQRLLKEQPEPPQLAAVQEELRLLQAKVEDAESELLQMTRDRIDAIKQRFRTGQFLLVAHEYALTYALVRLPRMLFNIAQAYRRAGYSEDAYLVYSRFLEEDPQTPLVKEVAGYQAELRSLVFRPPLFKRAWFWGAVGAAAAVLVAGSVGVSVALTPKDPETVLGTVGVSFGLMH